MSLKVGLKFVTTSREDIDTFLSIMDRASFDKVRFSLIVPEVLLPVYVNKITGRSILTIRSFTKLVKEKKDPFNIVVSCSGIFNEEEKGSIRKETAYKFLLSKIPNTDTPLIQSLDGITFECVVDPCDGYGSSSELLARGFSTICNTSIVPTRIENSNLLSNEMSELIQGEKKIYKNYLMYHTPAVSTTFKDAALSHRALLTMWESTKVPSMWPRLINEQFDFLIVPSRFCSDLFVNSGVSIPVHTIPLGIDTNFWTYKDRSNRDQPFEFLILANSNWENPRKNIVPTVNAFIKAFGNRSDVKLTVKITGGFSGVKPKLPSNVEVIDCKSSNEDLLKLYHRTDCLLGPSGGEGYSLIPRCAMATGLPVILNKWSAQEDLCIDDIAYWINPSGYIPAVRANYLVSQNNGSSDFGLYANVNTDELIDRMNYVMDHGEESLNKGKVASDFIRETSDFTLAARSIINLFNNYVRVGYYSTWNTSCGIALYTKHLVDALKAKGNYATAYSHTMDLGDVILKAKSERLDVLNLEYEPAIMPHHNDLINNLNTAKRLGVKVVSTFHSEPHNVVEVSKHVHKCIFHKNSVYLRDSPRVCNIPMGVPVFDPNESREQLKLRYGYKPEDVVITTVGFAFEWKQFPDILNLLIPRIKKHPNVKVQVIATHNDINSDECVKETRRISEVIDRYSFRDRITHISSFISQAELSERLYLSDIGYLWGSRSTTSSSAAGKEYITARLPLVTTDSNHYHDLSRGVLKTLADGNVFVDTVVSLATDTNRLSSMRSELEELYKSMNNLAIIDKHIEVFKS